MGSYSDLGDGSAGFLPTTSSEELEDTAYSPVGDAVGTVRSSVANLWKPRIPSGPLYGQSPLSRADSDASSSTGKFPIGDVVRQSGRPGPPRRSGALPLPSTRHLPSAMSYSDLGADTNGGFLPM